MKRKNRLAFVLILILGIASIASILLYGAHVAANTPQIFVRERRGTGERFYRETLGLNLDEEYPRTPQRLMDLYNTTTLFLYGNIILDPDMFMRVIEFQRQLFSEELRSITTAQRQFDNMMHNKETLGEAGIRVSDATVEDIRYDFVDQRVAAVHVHRRLFSYDDMYRIYYLILDDSDRWRIHSWEVTDYMFRPLYQ